MRPRFVVLFTVLVACDAAGDQGEAAIKGFVNALNASSPNQMAFVVEVGANNGAWTRRVMMHARGCKRVRVAPILFEPQREYAVPLQQLADDWGGTFYPALAWTDAANLTFYLSNFKEASSLSEHMALTFNNPEVNANVRRVIVPAVDFVRVAWKCVRRAKGGPIILKLDIEAAEYDLLPRLITSGVLCYCTFMLIEWHLNAMPPSRKLQGVLLRNALDGLLASGCKRPPQLILHDEDFLNNFGEGIPGLGELAARHQLRAHLPNRRPYAIASSIIASRRGV